MRQVQREYNRVSARRRLGTPLAVDGIYGPRTAYAIAALQRRYGLVPDGIYGPVTRARTRKLGWRV